MKTTILSLIILLITHCGIAQNYKYGKVSKEELQEQVNAQYPEANATVLNREINTYYEYKQGVGFTLFKEVLERIKIYDTEGFDWATKSIKIYNSGADREEIVTLKGVTYNLENGSASKTKFNDKDLFDLRQNDFLTVYKFTMPNIKKGSVIEYEYKISSPFYDIDDIDLQYTIPVKREVVEVRTPEYFIYQTYGNPQSKLHYDFSKDSREIDITLRGRSGLGTLAKFESSGKEDQTVSYKENIYRLEENNIPPMDVEVMVDNLDNYRAKSIWELAMINWPGELPKSYSTTWEAVTKSIYENDSFVNQLNKTSYYENDLNAAIGGEGDPLIKMQIIFNLVKSKVRWNKYQSYFPGEGLKKAYNEGVGNSADINLMLVSMLRYASLNANPILVSTKNNGIPIFPTRYGFNYVLASVEFNGKLYLMDATDPFSGINLLPDRVMNWEGRLIRPDGTSEGIGLYPNYVSQRMKYVQAEIKGDVLEASVRERLGGHFAKKYRSRFIGTETKEQIKAIKTTISDVHFSDYAVKDLDNLKPNLSLSYKAESPSMMENINGNLYISPMLFFGHVSHPFKSDKRSYPIYFEFPKSERYTVNLAIPEGYEVTSIPEGAKANLANNLGSYTYLLKQVSPQMLQLSVSLDINSPIILPSDYEYIKAFYNQIAEKEKEKIVLTKI